LKKKIRKDNKESSKEQNKYNSKIVVELKGTKKKGRKISRSIVKRSCTKIGSETSFKEAQTAVKTDEGE
jgi:hypothetical protein